MEILIENGTDVNIANKFGTTALHLAAFKGMHNAEKCKLITIFITVFAFNDEYHSTLNSVSGFGNIYKLLKNKGANENAKDANGITPNDIATKNGTEQLIFVKENLIFLLTAKLFFSFNTLRFGYIAKPLKTGADLKRELNEVWPTWTSTEVFRFQLHLWFHNKTQ